MGDTSKDGLLQSISLSRIDACCADTVEVQFFFGISIDYNPLNAWMSSVCSLLNLHFLMVFAAKQNVAEMFH